MISWQQAAMERPRSSVLSLGWWGNTWGELWEYGTWEDEDDDDNDDEDDDDDDDEEEEENDDKDGGDDDDDDEEEENDDKDGGDDVTWVGCVTPRQQQTMLGAPSMPKAHWRCGSQQPVLSRGVHFLRDYPRALG